MVAVIGYFDAKVAVTGYFYSKVVGVEHFIWLPRWSILKLGYLVLWLL